MKQHPFDDAFALVSESAHTDEGASLLVALCKAFDLRDEKHASAVKAIAAWIDSPHEQFRCEVVFALCLFRPVPRYEWVSSEGWKRAALANLHWYASAIECSFSTPSQVDARAVNVIAQRLSRPTPTADSLDASYYAFLGEALDDRAMELRETGRALGHLAGLFGLEHPALGESVAAEGDALEACAAGWRVLAQQLVDSVSGRAGGTAAGP